MNPEPIYSKPLSGIGKGAYTLILHLRHDKRIVIGKSRCRKHAPQKFFKGFYAYVGSALGPGGLASRINRHLRKNKKRRWHIDHLRIESDTLEVWVSNQQGRQEAKWAHLINRMPGARPVENFGNSDDPKSKTHLYYFQKRPLIKDFKELIKKEIPNHAPIRKIPLS